jgi:mono/diheme cytochrome c family protein
MMRVVRPIVWAMAVVAVIAAAGLAYLRVTGLRARVAPGALEARVARTVRAFAVPPAIRDRANPVARGDEAIRSGRAHFADHCATCHANDGSGMTELGRGLYPPPPDLRAGPTQEMSDGELFYVIEQGIRFTGMPGFGTGTEQGESESWKLVHFIRHLPHLSEAELDEMKALNPRSPADIRQEIEEEQFLRGETGAAATPHAH